MARTDATGNGTGAISAFLVEAGTPGLSLGKYGIERFYRNVRLFRIYEGTTQIQQIVIARELRREFEN
jgi:alkylation response protein AidB-like acyl-CoA dehydrogenase